MQNRTYPTNNYVCQFVIRPLVQNTKKHQTIKTYAVAHAWHMLPHFLFFIFYFFNNLLFTLSIAFLYLSFSLFICFISPLLYPCLGFFDILYSLLVLPSYFNRGYYPTGYRYKFEWFFLDNLVHLVN